MTDMRAQFEAWVAPDARDKPMLERSSGGSYKFMQTQLSWNVWQAASAALGAEVERLREVLSTAVGYMTNAAIDLDTGASKRKAIGTINGGIKLAREAMDNSGNG